MTLRARIAVTAAAAVTLAFLIAAGGLYAATARTLRGEVDRSLITLARDVRGGEAGRRAPGVGDTPLGPRIGRFGGAGGFVQLLDDDGSVLGALPSSSGLPVDERHVAVAAGRADAFLATQVVDDEPVRVFTTPVGPGLAAQVARPLAEVEASLTALRRRLVLGAGVGVALAAGLGLLVARGAVRPVERLTAVAEEVAATGDLSRRIGPAGGDTDDELGRLARTFDAMLANLEQARAAQQQLVADASHELRTPLTSLRTNIEVLTLDALARGADAPADAADAHARSDADDGAGSDAVHAAAVDAQTASLTPGERRALLTDLTAQLEEFGRLVGALVELARGEQPARGVVPVALDEVVAVAVDRARMFAPNGQQIALTTVPVTVDGEAERLDRAVANLLDNAVKYGQGRPIDVSVRRDDAGGVATGVVTVRDRGAGIAPADLPHVFDRFYRATAARDAPGSGLGLAIVQQVARAHGGTATVGATGDDGTELVVTLPARATQPAGRAGG